MKGALLLVLHSHLPYCKKAGVWPCGEEWVWEAMSESYIPIIDLICDRHDQGIETGITLCFSPILLEQLSDGYMQDRFVSYMRGRIQLAESDVAAFESQNEPEFARLATMYREGYEKSLQTFTDRFNCDLPGALARLAGAGCIEVMSSAATHAYLPLLATEESVRLQVDVGVATHKRLFGSAPRGFWLPECGYFPTGANRPGMEEILAGWGIEYFLVDAHALQGGSTAGVYLGPDRGQVESNAERIPGRTTFLPYTAGDSQLRVLGRNSRVGLQVWSECWGYPSDPAYREFHKRHENSGLRYWRITSKLIDLSGKAPYEPEVAEQRAREHAAHFAGLVKRQLMEFNERTGMCGAVVVPFDMELFGHWWFEGVEWLRACFREFARWDEFRIMCTSDYLDQVSPAGCIALPESSWGEGGKHRVWDNSRTRWIWENTHEGEQKMRALLKEVSPGFEQLPYLEQAVRELLLMQSSDWAFLVGTGQAEDYGNRQFLDHMARFERLLEMDDPRSLAWIQKRDNIFADIDLLRRWQRIAGRAGSSVKQEHTAIQGGIR